MAVGKLWLRITTVNNIGVQLANQINGCLDITNCDICYSGNICDVTIIVCYVWLWYVATEPQKLENTK